MDLLFALCLAIGLGACAGLRAFLPLFLLGLAVRFQFPLAPVGHNQEALFLASDLALICFGILTVLEIACDMVPLVDNSLQVSYFGLRPLAGAFAALAVLDGRTAGMVWLAIVISILVGALVSLPVHTTSATVRVVSTATTAGTANPLLSLKETFLSLFGVVGFLLLAPLALAMLVLFAWVVFRWVRGLVARRKSSPGLDLVPLR